jgi:protein-disulfide isomerase
MMMHSRQYNPLDRSVLPFRLCACAVLGLTLGCGASPVKSASPASVSAATTVAATPAAPAAAAQAQAPAQSLDSSPLRPPAGSRVAIVEFADLQCPACAAANTALKGAAEKYKIPWIRHDYLIPYHNWSKNAAINARWFDLKSRALGDEYRDQVFASQSSIYNTGVLAEFTQKFAQAHGMAMPFAVDPQGKLQAAINADAALAQQIGVKSTPTIYVVTSGSKGAPYIQVQKPATELYSTIDQAMADTRSAQAPQAKKTK